MPRNLPETSRRFLDSSHCRSVRRVAAPRLVRPAVLAALGSSRHSRSLRRVLSVALSLGVLRLRAPACSCALRARLLHSAALCCLLGRCAARVGRVPPRAGCLVRWRWPSRVCCAHSRSLPIAPGLRLRNQLLAPRPRPVGRWWVWRVCGRALRGRPFRTVWKRGGAVQCAHPRFGIVPGGRCSSALVARGGQFASQRITEGSDGRTINHRRPLLVTAAASIKSPLRSIIRILAADCPIEAI